MDKQTILDNCKRVMIFFKLPDVVEMNISDNPTTIDLLQWYGRVLDVVGAEPRGVSLIYLPNENEYQEVREHCRLNFADTFNDFIDNYIDHLPSGVMKYKSKRITFQYYGYYWTIINS